MNRVRNVAGHVSPSLTASGVVDGGPSATELVKEFFDAFSASSPEKTKARIAAVLADDFSYVGGDGTQKNKEQFVGTLPDKLDIHIRDGQVFVNADGSSAGVISVIPSMKLQLCEVFGVRSGKIKTLRVHK